MTVEGTFDTLADAAGCRYPNPDRENRGLCPAHDDHNNPGLVFRISESTGNLIVHCFAQHCSLDDIADSIGVSPSTFFKDGRTSRFATHTRAEWEEPSVLKLLKLLPLGMSFDQQVEAVFRVLDSSYHHPLGYDDIAYQQPIKEGTIDLELPLKHMNLVTRQTYLRLWCEDVYEPSEHNWKELEDRLLRFLMELNRAHRVNLLSTDSAIPRRG
jgi:hypothetical protein